MTTHSLVLAIHLLGCAFGVGASTILDLRVLQLLSGRTVSDEDVCIAQFLSLFVRVGLLLLWLSGLCFLGRYWLFAPELLANPKLHAKLAIVLTLTLNGLLIECIALPFLIRQRGRALFDALPQAAQSGALVVGCVSATSWYSAFALGILRELNFAVSAGVLLAVFSGLLALACATALLAKRVLYWPNLRKHRANCFQNDISGARWDGGRGSACALFRGRRPVPDTKAEGDIR